ncbi:MAG: agmatine deiminase family protein [Candidatus Fermentibacteraceae bacterium]
MKNLFLILILALSQGLYAEISVCGTEELMPIGFTESELAMLPMRGGRFEPTDPPPAGVRNPGEFEAATGIMVRWPLGVPYSFLTDVSNNSYLWVIVSSTQQTTAYNSLQSAGVNMGNTGFIIAPTNSIWVRDYGPWFITLPDGTQGIFNYEYNRPMRPQDNLIPIVIGAAWGIPVYSSEIIHTGGNYMSGGLGESMSTTMVYTENEPDPPSWVDLQMHDYLGVTTYSTFVDPQQSYIDHIDCWSKMLSPDRLMVLQVPPSHPDYAALEAVASVMANMDCPYGYPWDVSRVYSSGTEGYVNGLLHNDTYYMPVWNTGNDTPAVAAFQQALPGYTVKTVYYSGFENTDALHCRTRNAMDRYALWVNHTPVNQEQGTGAVTIEAFIRPHPDNTLTSHNLNYRTGGTGNFTTVAMAAMGGNVYSAQIPGFGTGTSVEYYITASDNSGRTAQHPLFAPETWFNTYSTGGTGIADLESPVVGVSMLSPNPFSAAMIFSTEGRPGNMMVFDASGRLVHRTSTTGEALLQWVPSAGIPSGVYFAVLELQGNTSSRALVYLEGR